MGKRGNPEAMERAKAFTTACRNGPRTGPKWEGRDILPRAHSFSLGTRKLRKVAKFPIFPLFYHHFFLVGKRGELADFATLRYPSLRQSAPHRAKGKNLNHDSV